MAAVWRTFWKKVMRKNILKEIKKNALKDQRNRRDPRYIRVMAFLTAKGFLLANQTFPHGGNMRLRIDDAVWAGKTLEPRILEVLPAADLRFGKHFDLEPAHHRELANTLADLKEFKAKGRDFQGVPYEKLKVWVSHKLKDGRLRTLENKKVPRNFRFSPQTILKLELLAKKFKKNQTAVLEDLIEQVP
jgi:hypothetical protein